AVARCAREWQLQLGTTDKTPRAAQIVVCFNIAWADRTAFVATNGTDTPGVDVLDDGESFSAVCLAPISHKVEGERVGAPQRDVVLMLAMQHVIAQIHRGEVSGQAAVVAARRC